MFYLYQSTKDCLAAALLFTEGRERILFYLGVTGVRPWCKATPLSPRERLENSFKNYKEISPAVAGEMNLTGTYGNLQVHLSPAYVPGLNMYTVHVEK
jgi:hypothetical protein